MRLTRAGGALLLALAALLPASAGAADRSVTIDEARDSVTWSGRAWTTTDAPLPETINVRVDLPHGFWDRPGVTGGVEIAIRWTSEYNVLDLYAVDERGAKVASSSGFPTSAQSLIIPKPDNGVYRVFVVPSAIQIDTGYEGLVQVEARTPHDGALLPDLQPLPPDELKLAAGALSFMPVEHRDTGGCYPDELAENPQLTRCLRFDSAVANYGAGPFELRLDTTDAATTATVRQDLYDGFGARVHTRPAGRYTFHATHAHFHYVGFASYALYALDDAGEPDFARPVAQSRKADFCMIDTKLLYWHEGPRGNGARNHHFPQCNLPGGDEAGPTEMRQGIDVGWADVYTWDLPGQYIDVSTVPSGDYALVVTVNPDGLLLESSTANNAAATRIRLTGTSVEKLG